MDGADLGRLFATCLASFVGSDFLLALVWGGDEGGEGEGDGDGDGDRDEEGGGGGGGLAGGLSNTKGFVAVLVLRSVIISSGCNMLNRFSWRGLSSSEILIVILFYKNIRIIIAKYDDNKRKMITLRRYLEGGSGTGVMGGGVDFVLLCDHDWGLGVGAFSFSASVLRGLFVSVVVETIESGSVGSIVSVEVVVEVVEVEVVVFVEVAAVKVVDSLLTRKMFPISGAVLLLSKI